MKEPEPVLKAEYLSKLPPVWPDETLRGQIKVRNSQARRCIVALDDDPTGTQTVHDVWVLACWEVSDLRAALSDAEPVLYILTNSRSMPLDEAQRINREIAANLVKAAKAEQRLVTVVSRSDSTLRGHYPGEVDALNEALAQAQGASFAGLCLIPFFPEGGRFTVDDVHWVQEGERLIPAAQTPYARDAVFGYTHSYLPSWIEEKTGGRVKASQVSSVTLDTIRRGGPGRVASLLRQVQDGGVVVVNATSDRDLEVFAAGWLEVEEQARHFLFRCAASFVKIAGGVSDKDLLSAKELVKTGSDGGGLVVFGSHVPKSTAQLAALHGVEGIQAVQLHVPQLLENATRQAAIDQAAKAVDAALTSREDVILYTSRELVTGNSQAENLDIGKSVSAALVQVVRAIRCRPRFVIGKGGITSSDLATQAMNVRAARVLGQVLPGVPVWKLGSASRWPGLPYIVFPGNVGDDQAVARVVMGLRAAG